MFKGEVFGVVGFLFAKGNLKFKWIELCKQGEEEKKKRQNKRCF
jgi:hypothetical protein